jgi:quercetin dioxygenase-like cupin family protein
MAETKNYFMNIDSRVEELGEGIKRKVKAYSDGLMLVEVHFETGAEGYVHEHFHEQCTYVLSGAFEFNVNGDKRVVKTGDTLYMEPNLPHGTICIEAGILLDVFTPARQDFLNK